MWLFWCVAVAAALPAPAAESVQALDARADPGAPGGWVWFRSSAPGAASRYYAVSAAADGDGDEVAFGLWWEGGEGRAEHQSRGGETQT